MVGFHWFRLVLCPLLLGNFFFCLQQVTSDTVDGRISAPVGSWFITSICRVSSILRGGWRGFIPPVGHPEPVFKVHGVLDGIVLRGPHPPRLPALPAVPAVHFHRLRLYAPPPPPQAPRNEAPWSTLVSARGRNKGKRLGNKPTAWAVLLGFPWVLNN